MNINWTTYDELRRDGLPSNREIVDAIETLQYVARQSANALVTPLEYRTLVRRKIPIELQDAYWNSCFLIEEQVEIYIDPCEKPDSVVVDPELVISILSDEKIITTMREWTSTARMTGAALIASGQGQTEVLQILDKEISK